MAAAAVVSTALIAVLALHAAGCSRGKYTKVTRTDGSTVIGTLVSMRPDVVVLQTRAGQLEIPRSEVRSLDEPTIAEITDLDGIGVREGTTAADQAGRNGARGTSSGGTAGSGASSGPDGGGAGAGTREGTTAGGQTGGGGAPGGQQAREGSNAGTTGGTGAGGASSGGGGSGGSGSGSGTGAPGVPGSSGNPGSPGTFARNDGGRGTGGTSASGTSGSRATGGASGSGGSGAGSGAGGTGGPGSGGGQGQPGTSAGNDGGRGGSGMPATGAGAGGRAAGPGEVAIPAGTAITLAFDAALASDTARVEQEVGATLRSAIVIGGARVVPAGARFMGRVTDVASARAAGGRGRIAVRFHTLTFNARTIAIDAPALPIQAEVFTRADKRKVGWGAAAGAALGGIVSKTKKGLGIGAAAGAGGTAAAVGLRNDVRIAPGTPIRLHLTQHVFVPAP
jgi:hypothetical protein